MITLTDNFNHTLSPEGGSAAHNVYSFTNEFSNPVVPNRLGLGSHLTSQISGDPREFFLKLVFVLVFKTVLKIRSGQY